MHAGMTCGVRFEAAVPQDHTRGVTVTRVRPRDRVLLRHGLLRGV
jgi:hypothetical protein